LEEFKQFLPESAAQARAAAAAKAAAEEAAANAASVASTAALSGPARQPILGSFAPPPIASKENKKKRGQANGEPAGRDIQALGQARPVAATKV
jgi:paired amphipathic helix protein Sin3a